MITLNRKDDGYRGIWYMCTPSNDEYVYKYSGGLGTYCAKHQPLAVYAPKVNKTFFVYGGGTLEDPTALQHMVSYYDHATGLLPRPTHLLDKQTDDAHDNPVLTIDPEGYLWVFSTSHGTSRPSYIHRSREPYSIDAFDLIPATRLIDGVPQPFDNFSYMQIWSVPGKGFAAFMTHYNDPAIRTAFFITSPDGVSWGEWKRLAAIEEGHYQISVQQDDKLACASNMHPAGRQQPGSEWRTNLYYMETVDFGETFRTVDGQTLDLPLTEIDNPALVHDFLSEGWNCYLKDIRLDESNRPIILFLTSRGPYSGPKYAPRIWRTARWTGEAWDIREAMTSDSNYDMGSLYLLGEGHWKIIAPTGDGPQPFNPGGDVEMWETTDFGATWNRTAALTADSDYNHCYVRRPVNAHPDFYGFWADGHARQPSESRLYFCTRDGKTFMMPQTCTDEFTAPIPL